MPIKSIALRALNLLHGVASLLPGIGRFRPLRGNFSAYAELQAGRLEGSVVAASQEKGASNPGSMTAISRLRQHDFQPWPIFWVRSDDATLVGRRHLWRDPQDLICEEAVYRHPKRISLGEDSWHSQIIVPEPRALPGAWTSLSSNWNDGGNYFHWIMDGLSRLLVRELLPEETRILIPSAAPRYVQETLALLGLSEQSTELPETSLRPERYYFCAPTAMTGVWNPIGTKWLRERFSPYFAGKDSGSPVFLTRRSGARIPENLDQIEGIMGSRGFEIVDCGRLSVRQQIEKLSAAPRIVGLHGAAFTNILWASPGTPVLEIFEPGYLNGCYEQMAYQAGLPHSFVSRGNGDEIAQIKKWCDRLT